MDPGWSLPACLPADISAAWMLERLLELPETAEESSFFADGCPANRLTLQPHQEAQASLPTGVRGSGLSSVEPRRMSASIGSLIDGARGPCSPLRRKNPERTAQFGSRSPYME